MIGCHAAAGLAAAGHGVTALVRDPEKLTRVMAPFPGGFRRGGAARRHHGPGVRAARPRGLRRSATRRGPFLPFARRRGAPGSGERTGGGECPEGCCRGPPRAHPLRLQRHGDFLAGFIAAAGLGPGGGHAQHVFLVEGSGGAMRARAPRGGCTAPHRLPLGDPGPPRSHGGERSRRDGRGHAGRPHPRHRGRARLHGRARSRGTLRRALCSSGPAAAFDVHLRVPHPPPLLRTPVRTHRPRAQGATPSRASFALDGPHQRYRPGAAARFVAGQRGKR